MKIDVVSRPPPSPSPASGRNGKRHIRLRTYGTLILADCAAIVVAFLVASLLRFGFAWNDLVAIPGTRMLVLILPVYLAIAADRRLYSSQFFLNWRRNAYGAVKTLGAALLAVLLIGFYLHAAADVSRIVISIGGVIGALLLIGVRVALHRRSMHLMRGEPITTLVIRDGVDPVVVDAAIVDAADCDIRPTVTDPHMLDRFGSLARGAERVIVSCPVDRRALWAAMLQGANVQGELVTPELIDLGMLRSSSYAGQPTLIVSLGPLDTRNRVLKRSFDLSTALVVITLALPLLALVALAIRLDSPGPVLFRQPRMGRGNRLFSMYKFRSMRSDACDVAGARSTERGDPRITRVGRFLRSSSIDELPQLFNVLRGDMSIVGPRPHALGSLAGTQLFWEISERYWDRHAAKPGITGLAQINGFRGATDQVADLEGRLDADLAYLVGWTIWRDLRILVATTLVVFHRNAF